MTRAVRRTPVLLRVASIVVACGVLAAATAGARQAPSRVHPISGRVYAGAMDVSGAAWLDRPERDQEESTERVLKLIGIERGSTVADVGAGSGYFTVRMAAQVGPDGRVYANDIQQGMLDLVRRRVDKAKLKNVTLVLGSDDDPRLPSASVDLALLVDVYHEFLKPQAMLQRLRDALKPGGRLVLLEYRQEDPNVPILPAHKMSVAGAKLEVEHEGFALTKVNEDLPWQHILIFTRP